jgi:hypothetical protein
MFLSGGAVIDPEPEGRAMGPELEPNQVGLCAGLIHDTLLNRDEGAHILGGQLFRLHAFRLEFMTTDEAEP